MPGLLTVGAESEIARDQGTVPLGGVENHPLALPQHAKERTFERPGAQHDLALAAITEDDADAGLRIVNLDYTLHD